jgi:hypothetical protein
MFKNRHVIVALLVAPVLAILSWFAAGSLWGERAAPAQPGNAYPLVARSNCRWASGQCDLENNDLELILRYEPALEGVLVLSASHALDSVLVALAPPGEDVSPRRMRPSGADGRQWRLALAKPPGNGLRLRLVAAAAGASYFGDAAALFLTGGGSEGEG